MNPLDLFSAMSWIMQKVQYMNIPMWMVRKKNQTSASRSLIDLIGTDKELLERGNTLFRKCSILFGYIGLLSTVFANAILTNSKNAIKFVEWAVEANEEWGNLIVLLGDIHR